MADIRKRRGAKGPQYQVRYASEKATTGYAYRTFDTLKEAVAFRDQCGSLRDAPHVGRRATTVSEAVDRWLEVCETEGRDGRDPVTDFTLKGYRRLAITIKEYSWTKPLAALSAPDAVEFRSWLLKTQSRDKAKKVLSVFHSVVLEVVGRGVMPHDIVSGIGIRGQSRYDEPVRVPTEKDIMALLAAADSLANSKNGKVRDAWRRYGLTREERTAMVTNAWQRSDTPRAFVRALEDMGYMLATGNRPYVLIDRYGTMNALARLIDDRSVRTKDLRAFLGKEFPPEQLPTVEEARALVEGHRKAQEQFAKAQDDGRRRAQLKTVQEKRRAGLIEERAALRDRQAREVDALNRAQRDARSAARRRFSDDLARTRAEREAARPAGPAAFLGRVTGVTAIIAALHRRRDLQRYREFRGELAALAVTQRADADLLQRRHELQAMEVARKVSALDKIDAREMRALEEKRMRAYRTAQREGADHMPTLSFELKPGRRGASVRKAKNRYQDSLRTPEERQARAEPQGPVDLRAAHEEALAADTPIRRPVDLTATFARAAEGTGEGGESSGDAGGIPDKPVSRASRSSERGRERRGRDDDFERER